MRCQVLFTHYESADRITIPELKDTAGLPHSGMKGRMVQTCSAMGRVQLRHYDRRMGEIDRAMNRFWYEIWTEIQGNLTDSLRIPWIFCDVGIFGGYFRQRPPSPCGRWASVLGFSRWRRWRPISWRCSAS